jgi:tetratricopeptide (TPR) repeat protein
MQMDINDQMIAQRAETLRLSGAYEQAIELFEQLQMYPDNAWVKAHLGATYYHLMDYGKAEHYLKKAIDKNDRYFWAHAQLGETYRLRAITENNKRPDYVELAIEHFQKALDRPPEDSNYVWALAHLGATYRLNITYGIIPFLNELIHQESSTANYLGKENIKQQKKIMQPAEEALKCLNRAIQLMPTYAWAWGMRATIYRLTHHYENSFWDLEVEALIAPNIEIMQQSPSPVPFLQSGRVSLYEHAFLSFYLTKNHSDLDEKKIHYLRATAFLQRALILRPSDLIAELILTIIEANQKKEEEGSLEPDDIKKIQRKLDRFFEDTDVEFAQKCQKILRYLINVPEPSVSINQLELIAHHAEEGHKLKKLVLEEVIKDHTSGVVEEPQLWLWKNFALTEIYSYVLFFLGEVSHLLGHKSNIGTAGPYLELAFLINPYIFTERLYQTPVFSHEDRARIVKNLNQGIGLKFYESH